MDIVQDILTDSARGARRLEKEYKAQLYAVALRLGADPEEAEALAWRTIDEAVRRIGDYTEQSAFFAWLCKILVNCRSKSLRRKSNERILYTDELPETSEDVDGGGASGVVQAVDAGILRDAIESLPEEMKEAVILRYFMDVPIRKMAQIFSVPVGTVKSRLYYARIVLARRLGVSLKKHAVALVAATLFLLAGAATVKAIVRAAVAENEDGRLQAVDIIEPTSGDAIPGGTAFISSDPSHAESDLSRPSAASQPSFAKAKGENPLNLSAAKGKEDMNIRQQAATALAAATLAASSASATTVAWYHFNEGANGTKPANAQPVFVNAADPGSLNATPRVRRSWSTAMEFVDNNATYLPVYTNDFPSCVSWFDPATGARGEDRRCLWMHTAYNYGHGDAPIVLVDDDEKLHCANITAECMVKLTVPSGSKLSYQAHMLVMRNSPTSETTANVKAWGMIINANGTVRVEMQTRDSTGLAADTSKNLSFVTPTSSPSVTDGKWHHVAFTYDGATVRIYVDYVECASQAWSEPIDYNENLQGRLNIAGLDVSNYGGHWYGFVDEVRISDAALPPERFLRVCESAGFAASDADTAIYLPFNTLDAKNDPFFFNSACSANANLISMRFSTSGAGIWPCIDTGAADVVSNELHAGIWATDTIDNTGCWRFTNTLANADSAYHGKARNIWIDDFSQNNDTHLISSGDFTAECWIKVPVAPVFQRRILYEDTGVKNVSTIQLYVDSSWLYCRLCPRDQFDKYQSGEIASLSNISWKDWYVSIGNIMDDDWHHIALVVDRANQKARFYLDRQLVLNREVSNFTLASEVSGSGNYRYLKIGDGGDGNNKAGLQDVAIDEFRITRRALAPQEFLMAGASVDQSAFEPTRAWFRFEGDLGAEPSEGAIPAGSFTAGTVTMAYSPVVPGVRIVDGNGNDIRAANESSMYFSGAHGSGESSSDTANQRLFFSRNLLLEKDMKSMTVEFFMKGTKNEAKAWAYILRMYGNATGSDSSPFRRLWSVGYSNTAGNLYVIKDVNGASQPTFYPDNTVSFADDRWHHVAVTFEPDGNGNTLCTFYRDYQRLGSQFTFDGEMECGDYGTSSLAMGSRYNGYLDEVRVSKGVLTVDQMMHVIKRGMVISFR